MEDTKKKSLNSVQQIVIAYFICHQLIILAFGQSTLDLCVDIKNKTNL